MHLFNRVFFILCALCTLSANASVITISSAPSTNLTEQVEWCITNAKTTISDIQSGTCQFKAATFADMSQGFSKQAYWLRITLSNPESISSEHWLSIGHPRLQQVSMFESNKSGHWLRTDTGLSIPAEKRPIVAALPLLPVSLQQQEIKTLYIRVASQTSVTLTPTLWIPNSYRASHVRLEIIQALTIGGLFMAAVFALIIYAKQRERIYLYFALSILFEIILDAIITGLLPAYLWPVNLAFDIRVQVIATCLSILFLVLLVRSFIENIDKYRAFDLLIKLFSGILILATAWACLINYGEALKIISICVLAVILIGIALFFRAWNDGSRPAGYMLISYSTLALLIIYRVLAAFGMSSTSPIQSYGFSWCFLLITPTIFIGMVQRTTELRHALKSAHQEVSSRIEFLAKMSHEFRTPLNTILGHAQLLERGSSRLSLTEGISAIKHSSNFLLSMIDEILDHARGVAGKLALSIAPVHWESFIKSLNHNSTLMMQSRANRFELQLSGHFPSAIMADERRLSQVLNNLLGNANRYTNGLITLSVSASILDGEHCQLTFTVSDQGRGIKTEEQNNIFQPFIRGEAGKNSGIDGSGMGLTISQQLISLMGGKINLKSEAGSGSQFSFTLCCATAVACPSVDSATEYGLSSQAKTILVIDDEPNSRNLLSILLTDCGFTVHCANSGHEAIQLINDSIDLIITDQFMPEGDGWYVLQHSADIPTILLSAAPPTVPHNWPPELKFSDIQLKPFNSNVLLNSICKILNIEMTEKVISAPDVDIQPPPMFLLAALIPMIEQGAVTDMTLWLEDFSAAHPIHAAYTKKLTSAVMTLNIAELRKLTGATQEPATRP
ncbi:MAG: ATP-binding protein [Gallionella sp.]|jgi:signal transduction histidine kinase/CheY-like chemotaxis protein